MVNEEEGDSAILRYNNHLPELEAKEEKKNIEKWNQHKENDSADLAKKQSRMETEDSRW